jgi:enoyl-CoA hydratase/carnithine racemase
MTRGFEFIRLQISARVAWLEFNRAPVNAFNREMVLEVREAIATALTDPEVRVLVLASAIAGYFSAGADLHEFEGMKAPNMRGWVSICHEIARLLRSSPKPLLAAINGTAVGGGLEMALHCDLRFASSDAKLGQPEIRIAFIPPIATTQALARLLGRPRAIRYLYEGRLLGAAEALTWGLVDEVVEPDDLRRRVQDYAEDLAAKPAAALAAIRTTITLGGGVSFEEGMALELETATALADTSDFAEGVDAFLNKRAPRWAGS